MTAEEVKQAKNGSPIQKISGKVTGVYLKDQTEGQKKVGIHQQDVQILSPEDGSKIKVVIMNAGMHLPKDAVGRTFTFECTPGENGKPSGVQKNEWNGFHSVQVQKDGIITGDKAKVYRWPADASPPNSQKQIDMTRSSKKPTIKDHVRVNVEILRMFEEELAGTAFGENFDLMQKLASGVYIQANKEGLIEAADTVPQNVVQMADEAHHAMMNGPRIQQSIGPALKEHVPSVSDAYIVGKALKGELKADEVNSLHKTGKYDWEKLYDQFEQQLIKDGYDPVTIGGVYDNMKAVYSRSSGKYNNADFCRMILSDPATFIEALHGETEVSEYREPASKSKNDDDIPF